MPVDVLHLYFLLLKVEKRYKMYMSYSNIIKTSENTKMQNERTINLVSATQSHPSKTLLYIPKF